MKKIFILFLLLLSFYKNNFAQKEGYQSSITTDDLKMTSYPNDVKAEAVIFYEKGQSYFVQTESSFELNFDYKLRLKILNQAGIKFGTIEIPIYLGENGFENLEAVKGVTYNLFDGQIKTSALDTKNIYEEKNSTNWVVKKFAMPDVKEGSIIEVAYKITSPYFFNFRSWYFQKEIPVIYSEYLAKMIPFYAYTYIAQAVSKFDDFKTFTEQGLQSNFQGIKYNDVVYKFVLNDIPAFRDESFITSSKDYMIKLDFQLSAIHYPNGTNVDIMTTWTNMVDEFLKEENFGRYMKKAQSSSKDIVTPIITANQNLLDRAKAIDLYMKSNFNWNGNIDKFSHQSVKDFLKSKAGNVGDINLFLCGMLNEAGIEAYPLLLSTRDHGKIKGDYPFQHFFNYIVAFAKIDGKTYLLDATEPLLKFAKLPAKCINDKGLLIKKDKNSIWAGYQDEDVSDRRYTIKIDIDTTNNQSNAKFELKTSGYEAISDREDYLAQSKELKENLEKNRITLTDSITEKNLKEIDQPFELSFSGKSEIKKIENNLIVQPFFNLSYTTNPLKQALRTYPIDMIYKLRTSFITTLTIPKGYKLANHPENYRIDNDDVCIYLVSDISENSKYTISAYFEFKKAVYQPESYFNMKTYFNTIVKRFNEEIVLAKN